jgi:hypothetical protein
MVPATAVAGCDWRLGCGLAFASLASVPRPGGVTSAPASCGGAAPPGGSWPGSRRKGKIQALGCHSPVLGCEGCIGLGFN